MDAVASGDLHRTKRSQRTAKSCGPGAATLALRWRVFLLTTGARKAASPGRARISRKTIARGKPGCLGCTCQIRVHSFATIAHGAAGAVGARLSLRPRFRKRANEIAEPERKRAAGMRALVSPSLRAKRSNPALPQQGKLDCFVAEPVIGRAFARPVGSSQ